LLGKYVDGKYNRNLYGHFLLVKFTISAFSFVAGGLLHSIPKHDEENNVQRKIKKALFECVEEKKPGERVKAVNELADLLALFVRLH